MTDLQAKAVWYAIEQIRITVDQLREAWAWLLELAEPGPETSRPAQAMTDQLAEQLEARGHSDRAYRAWNLARGTSALPPSPAPVRVGVVDAQVLVDRLVAAAVLTLAQTGGEQTQARADAATAAGVPAMLDWITGWEIGLGASGRDGVWLKQGAIDRVRDAQLAGDVEQLLTRADRAGRAAAALDDDPGEQLVDPATGRPARCPACRRRSLQRETTGLIRCVSQACVCTGDATADQDECGCRRAEKRPELRHVWIRAAEHELWNAIGYDRTPAGRPGVGRGATGHGGWQSRDMAGQQ